jgi:ERCC4-type nuclease
VQLITAQAFYGETIMLLSILYNGLDMQSQPDWGMPAISAPIAPASYLAVCADGAQLAIRVMTTNDLRHALRNKTLYADMIKLRNLSPWAYLITLEGKRTLEDDLSGALLSVQETGVGTLHIKQETLVETVQRLAKRDRTPRRVRPPRDVLFADPDLDMLLALPGIGEQKAEALLQYCGGAAWALMVLTDDKHEFPGIGQETRRKVREALGLHDDMGFRVESHEPQEATT